MRKRSFLLFLTILLFGASALAGCTLPASSSSVSSSSSSSTSSSSIQSSTSSESSSSVSSASSDSSSSSVDSSTSSSPSSSSSSSSSSATQPLEVAFELDLDDAKVTFAYGEAFAATGLAVYGVYDDDSRVLVETNQYTVAAPTYQATLPGTYRVNITYKTYPVQHYDVTVTDKIENGFELDTSLVVTDLAYGQLLNTDPLKVYATYRVGERELLPTSAYQIRLGSYAYNNPGVHDIIVAYSTYPDQTFQVTVGEPEEVRFGIDDSAVNHMLDYGQELDLTPLDVFTFNQIDEPTPLLSGYTIDQGGFSSTVPGTYTITVSYKTYLDKTFEVTVAEPLPTGLILNTTSWNDKVPYGEQPDFTNLLVSLEYEDGSVEPLTDTQYTIDLGTYAANTPDIYTITVHYLTWDASFTVEVLATEPASLEVDSTSVDTSLLRGSGFDYTTLQVYLVYEDDHSALLDPSEYFVDLTGFDKDVAGDYTITVTHLATEFSTTFLVNVYEPNEVGFSINHTNVQKIYPYGEELDLSLLQVFAHYDEGDPRLLDPSAYLVDEGGYMSMAPGPYTITISYKTYPDLYFYVTVEPPPVVLTHIEADPSAVDLTIAENFGEVYDLSQLTVAAFYSDASVIPLAYQEFEIDFGLRTPRTDPTLGEVEDQIVTITYSAEGSIFTDFFTFTYYSRLATEVTLDTGDAQTSFLYPVTETLQSNFYYTISTVHFNDGYMESFDYDEFETRLILPEGVSVPAYGEPYAPGIYQLEFFSSNYSVSTMLEITLYPDTITPTSMSIDTSNLVVEIPYDSSFNPSLYYFDLDFGQILVTLHLSNGDTMLVKDFGINFDPTFSTTSPGTYKITIQWGTVVDPVSFDIQVLPEPPSLDIKEFMFNEAPLLPEESGQYVGVVDAGASSFSAFVDPQYSQATVAWMLADGTPVVPNANNLITFSGEDEILYQIRVSYGEGETYHEQLYSFVLAIRPSFSLSVEINDVPVIFDPDNFVTVSLPQGDAPYTLEWVIPAYYRAEIRVNGMVVDPLTYPFMLADEDDYQALTIKIFAGETLHDWYDIEIVHERILMEIWLNETVLEELTPFDVPTISITNYLHSFDFGWSFTDPLVESNYDVQLSFFDPVTFEEYLVTDTLSPSVYLGEHFFILAVYDIATGLVREEYPFFLNYDPDIALSSTISLDGEPVFIDNSAVFMVPMDAPSAVLEITGINPDYWVSVYNRATGLEIGSGIGSLTVTLEPVLGRFTYFDVVFSANESYERYTIRFTLLRDFLMSFENQYETISFAGQPVMFSEDFLMTGHVYLPETLVLGPADIQVDYGVFETTTSIVRFETDFVNDSLVQLYFYDATETLLGLVDVQIEWVSETFPLMVALDDNLLTDPDGNGIYYADELIIDGREGLDGIPLYVMTMNPSATLSYAGQTVPSGQPLYLYPTLGGNSFDLLITLGETTQELYLYFYIEEFTEVARVVEIGLQVNLSAFNETIDQYSTPNFDDAIVYVLYSNDTSSQLFHNPDGYSIDAGSFDASVPGTYDFFIVYHEFRYPFEVTVVPVVIPTNLVIDSSAVPAVDTGELNFDVADFFNGNPDYGQVVVTLHFDDSSSEILTYLDDFYIETPDWTSKSAPGTYTIVIHHTSYALQESITFEWVAETPSTTLDLLEVDGVMLSPDEFGDYYLMIDPDAVELALAILPDYSLAEVTVYLNDETTPLSLDPTVSIPASGDFSLRIQVSADSLSADYILYVGRISPNLIVNVNGAIVTFPEASENTNDHYAYVAIPRESSVFDFFASVDTGYYVEIYENGAFITNPTHEFSLLENDFMTYIDVEIYRDGGQYIDTYYLSIHRESILDGFYFNDVFYSRDQWSQGFWYDIVHTAYTDTLTITPSFDTGIDPLLYEVQFVNHMTNSFYEFPLSIYVDHYFMMVDVVEIASGKQMELIDLSFEYAPGVTPLTSLTVNGYSIEDGEYYVTIDTNVTTAHLELVTDPLYAFALTDLAGNVLATDPASLYLSDITNRPHDFILRFTAADAKVYRYKLTLQRFDNWNINYYVQGGTVWGEPAYADTDLAGTNYAFVRIPTGTVLTTSDLVLTYEPGYITSYEVELVNPALYRVAIYAGEELIGYVEVEVLYTDLDAILYVSMPFDDYEYYFLENEEAGDTIVLDQIIMNGVEGSATIDLRFGVFHDTAVLVSNGITYPNGGLIPFTPMLGENTYTLTVIVNEIPRDYTLILDVMMFRELYFRTSLNYSDYEFASEISNYLYDINTEVYILNDTVYLPTTTIPFIVTQLASNIQVIPSANGTDPVAVEEQTYQINVIQDDPTFGDHVQFWILIDGVAHRAIVPVFLFN